jgi:hypothetical protein
MDTSLEVAFFAFAQKIKARKGTNGEFTGGAFIKR